MSLLAVLTYATPVTLAATGETLGQRAGIVNIGLEGMVLSSSFIAVVVTQRTGSVALGIFAALVVALMLGTLQLLFTLRLAADQVVVGTAINLFSFGATSALYRQIYGQTGTLITIRGLPPILGELDLVTLCTLVLVGGAGWVLAKTPWGLRVRATGELPKAVDAAGLSALRTRWEAGLIAAAFAGLAGAHLGLGVTRTFNENMSGGVGFLAIAMVTFGRWRPLLVMAAGVLLYLVQERQFALQAAGVKLPQQLFNAAPYLVALLVLIIVGKGSRAPASLGQPYTPTQ